MCTTEKCHLFLQDFAAGLSFAWNSLLRVQSQTDVTMEKGEDETLNVRLRRCQKLIKAISLLLAKLKISS